VVPPLVVPHDDPWRWPAPYGLRWVLLLFGVDFAVFASAALVTLSLTGGGQAAGTLRPELVIALLAAILLWHVLFAAVGLYRHSFSASPRDEIYSAVAALCLGAFPVLAVTVVPQFAWLRSSLALMFVLSAVGVGVARAALHTVRARLIVQRERRIAVVGTPGRVDEVVRALTLAPRDAVLRLPIEASFERLARGHRIVEKLPWVRGATAWKCDTLLVSEPLPPGVVPALLNITERQGIKLAFAPTENGPKAFDLSILVKTLAESLDFTLQEDCGLALICPRRLAICMPGAMLLRRVLNLALVVPALVLLAPLLILIGVAVAIDSGRPVIYRQTRVGLRGREFEILKFRTMPVDAENETGAVWADESGSRCSRVGRILRRTSLDELPQLFNVLRGEMALVGPRPERPVFVEQFRRMYPRYDERLLAPPGITGWSHVNMRRNVDASAMGKRLSYDLFYFEHWSPFLDLTILVKTAAEFLFHNAA
jgi:exopolysaccharide biosynthesis polyprenyl glycosylphosphotransferase